MNKWMLVVICSVVAVSTVATAQQYRIIPSESKRDLERRIWQLENAVNELQVRVYDLQTAQMQQQQKPAAPNNKAFLCSVETFGKTYKSFGPTQLEAKEKTLTACTKDYNSMHCDPIRCEKND